MQIAVETDGPDFPDALCKVRALIGRKRHTPVAGAWLMRRSGHVLCDGSSKVSHPSPSNFFLPQRLTLKHADTSPLPPALFIPLLISLLQLLFHHHNGFRKGYVRLQPPTSSSFLPIATPLLRSLSLRIPSDLCLENRKGYGSCFVSFPAPQAALLARWQLCARDSGETCSADLPAFYCLIHHADC